MYKNYWIFSCLPEQKITLSAIDLSDLTKLAGKVPDYPLMRDEQNPIWLFEDNELAF